MTCFAGSWPAPRSRRRAAGRESTGGWSCICLKAMVRDPAARFPTMAAFAEALEAYGTGRGSAAPPTAPEPAQKATSRPRPSRRLLWLAGVLLGAVVVAAIAAVGFALSRQGPAAHSGQASAADQPPVVPTAPHDGGTPGGGADGFSAGGMWVGTFERPGDNYAYRAAVQIEPARGKSSKGRTLPGTAIASGRSRGRFAATRSGGNSPRPYTRRVTRQPSSARRPSRASCSTATGLKAGGRTRRRGRTWSLLARNSPGGRTVSRLDGQTSRKRAKGSSNPSLALPACVIRAGRRRVISGPSPWTTRSPRCGCSS